MDPWPQPTKVVGQDTPITASMEGMPARKEANVDLRTRVDSQAYANRIGDSYMKISQVIVNPKPLWPVYYI